MFLARALKMGVMPMTALKKDKHLIVAENLLKLNVIGLISLLIFDKTI